MAGSDPVSGPRVLAAIQLLATDEGGLDFEVKEGNRSLLFVFPPLDRDPVQHGAVIEAVSGEARPGGGVVAHVQFFHDSAAIVAAPGAEFDVWLGRTVGRGVVNDVLDL